MVDHKNEVAFEHIHLDMVSGGFITVSYLIDATQADVCTLWEYKCLVKPIRNTHMSGYENV